MAGTFTVTGKISLVNGDQKVTIREPGTDTFTQTGQGVHQPAWIVGTSEEALTVGDISTLGRIYFKNLDSTNYVDIGPDSGGSMVGCIRLKPGEEHWFRSKPGITWKGQANTAACKVEVKICED